MHEYLQNGNSSDFDRNPEYKRKRKDFLEKISGRLKNSLIEGGIDAEKIIIKSEYPSEQELQEIDQSGSWILVDRHSAISGRKFATAKCLSLPESNFFEDARENGLIDIPQEEFSQKLEEIFKEKFGD